MASQRQLRVAVAVLLPVSTVLAVSALGPGTPLQPMSAAAAESATLVIAQNQAPSTSQPAQPSNQPNAQPPAPTAVQPPAGGTAPAASPVPSAGTPAAPTPAAPGAPPGASPPPQTQPPQAPSQTPAGPGETPSAPGQMPGATALPPVQVIQEQPKPAPRRITAPVRKTPAEPASPKVAAAPPAAAPPQAAAAPQSPPAASGPPPTALAQPPPSAALPGSVEAGFVRISPVAGSEIAIAKVAGSVSTVTAAEIARSGASSIADALATSVPGVIISDVQGNAFQTDIQFRGFQASPVDGVPQGLAVYQNGVRINESFGDTLNFDFLPAIAINDITVLSNNPVFGLNAIGGAVSIGMKDGFTFQGVETDLRAGSFGRRQGSLQAGQRSGAYAAYIALEDIHDDGYREQGNANIRRLYADLGAKGNGHEFHLSFTGANNFVGASNAAPVELLAQNRAAIFTNPQTTTNVLEMLQGNAALSLSETVKVSAVGYFRHFNQSHLDGNNSSAQDCAGFGGTAGVLCLANVDGTVTQLADQSGNAIATPNAPAIGELNRTSLDADSFGGSVQGVDKSKIFDHTNQALIGASIDHGEVRYDASAEIGGIGVPGLVVTGTGSIVANSVIHPRLIDTTNTYYGLYFSDTFDVTAALTVTVGGRYNVAQIELADANGLSPSLNSRQTYERFNPMAGATFEIVPGISLYGGYSEANRAPVPAELACADPLNPCLIPAFLTSDPPLKQVVSHTSEVGIRGETKSLSGAAKIDWGLGFFRTLNSDDIINGYSALIGRSFVQNGGQTLRQGLEAKISYRDAQWLLYANYNYVDATFQSALTLNSPNNPLNPAIGNDFPTQVRPGDRLPGIATHKFKGGFDYRATPEWKFGADLLVASDTVFFADEANQNPHLPGYATLNVHTAYDLTENVQIYGLFNNVTETRYSTLGTYFNTSTLPGFTDPRTIVPAPPFTAYGGVKVKF